MAFFDKLKGVAEKAKDAAVKAVTAATEMAGQAVEKAEQDRQAAQKAEAERLAAKEEAEKAARLAMRDRIVNGDSNDEIMLYLETATDEEIAELDRLCNERKNAICAEQIQKLVQSTNCDQGKGDCFWVGDSFYCSCGDNVDCPRKTYLQRHQMGKLIAPEHMPYIKFLSSFYRDGELQVSRSDIDISVFEAFRCFVNKFLPEHEPSTWGDAAAEVVSFFLSYGMGAENIVMEILVSIHEQTGGKVVPPLDFLIGIYHDIIHSDDECDYMNIAMPFFKNPSLYDRSREDLEYTAKMLDIASNPDKWAAASWNPDKVSLEKLFNEDGTIKEAGIGGPRKGFYGDVIYNIVNSWTN